MKFGFTLGLLFSVSLFSCKKEAIIPDDENNIPTIDSIFAGDTLKATYLLINDSTYMGYRLDINADGIEDLSFHSTFSAICASESFTIRSQITCFSHTEIIINTDSIEIDSVTYGSSHEHFKIYKKEDTPKRLDKNYIIQNKDSWANTEAYRLHDRIDIIDDHCNTEYALSYNGWLNNEDMYMGFRILNESDTLYGWISIKVSLWHSSSFKYGIIVKDYAYR